MINYDDSTLTRIVAEEVNQPNFPAEEFGELLAEIGQAANSTVTACMLAITLFQQTKQALMSHFSGKRAVFRSEAVDRAFERYLEADG